MIEEKVKRLDAVRVQYVAQALVERPSIDDILTRLFPKRMLHRVLLVNPPDAHAKLFRWETAKRGRYTNYPPYGLGIIAANLRKVRCEVRILNLNHAVLEAARSLDGPEYFDFDATWQELLNDEICEFQPHMIGIGCMFTMTHTSFRQVCTYAAVAEFPSLLEECMSQMMWSESSTTSQTSTSLSYESPMYLSETSWSTCGTPSATSWRRRQFVLVGDGSVIATSERLRLSRRPRHDSRLQPNSARSDVSGGNRGCLLLLQAARYHIRYGSEQSRLSCPMHLL